MTLSRFIAAVRSALSAAMGGDYTVCAADDEFSALEILAGSVPDSVRVVIFCGELAAVEGDGMGMVCRLSTRIVVQVRRGLAIDATSEAQLALLNAEQAVRTWALSLLFHQEGRSAPTWDEVSRGIGLHPTVGQFVHEGSGAYQGPVADVMLEHPARELRFNNLIGLESPNDAIPVPLPL